MAKLIIARDAQVVQTVQLKQGRTSLGRRSRNDVVLAHPTVSGAHAVVDSVAGDCFLEDLSSTNGSFVNGRRVGRHLLRPGDRITLAVFHIEFVADAADAYAPADTVAVAAATPPAGAPPARLEVLSGASAGRQLTLDKEETRLGQAGKPVALISRAADGYLLAGAAGAEAPLLNGVALGRRAQALANGDVIEAGGVRMAFTLA